jgi:heme exporter protein A
VTRAAPAGSAARGPAVRLRGIRKRFGYRETLRGIDLELEEGGSLAVFGPNGAGKSTLLRIIATLWSPSAGGGEIFGGDLRRDARRIRGRLGAVLHQSFLRPELTLRENLRFTRDLYGLSGPDPSGELLERFTLSHRLDDPIATFSQGMLKRASIIRSLVHSPALWLLDEPFSGLDPAGRGLLEELIRDYGQRGGACILVTHDHDAGLRLAERSIVLEDGEIVRARGERPRQEAALS